MHRISILGSDRDFQTLFKDVAARPEMFLPDRKFNTVVAFVEGCDAATRGSLLVGFSNWIHENILGYTTNFHWSTVIASKYAPGGLSETWPAEVVDNASFETSAVRELTTQLDRFLGHRSLQP